MISYFEKVGTSTVDSETCIEIAPPTGMAGNVELNTTASPPAQTFLFDPSTFDAVKKAKNRVRDWVLHYLPDALKNYLEKDRAGLSIFVNEVNCGNGRCAPIHVSITLLSKEPGKLHRTIDIPKALADVRQKDVADSIDFVSDDLLGCVPDDLPTRKRPRTALECMKDPGSAGFFGKLLRVHDSATDALLAAVAKHLVDPLDSVLRDDLADPVSAGVVDRNEVVVSPQTIAHFLFGDFEFSAVKIISSVMTGLIFELIFCFQFKKPLFLLTE